MPSSVFGVWIADDSSPRSDRFIRSIQIMDDELCILDPGEREAIALAEVSQIPVILLDEKMARSIAQQRGLSA